MEVGGLSIVSALGPAFAGYGFMLAAGTVALTQAILFMRRPAESRGRLFKPILLMAFQVGIYAVSLAMGGASAVSVRKFELFCASGLMLTAAAALNYAGETRRIRQLLFAMLLASFSPLILVLIVPRLMQLSELAYRMEKANLDPITVGRVFGMGGLLAIMYAMLSRGWKRASFFIVATFLIFLQLIIAKRGPVFSLGVALLFFSHRTMRRFRISTLFLGLAVLAGLTALPFWQEQFGAAAIGNDARVRILLAGVDAFLEHPFIGVGLGTFGGTSQIDYVHNIFAELAVETGLLGLAAFVAYLYVTLRKSNTRTPETIMVATLTVYWIGAAQVSGDISANPMCFVMPMLWACASFNNRAAPQTAAAGIRAQTRVHTGPVMAMRKTI
jgi:O-antigen ligase